MLMKILYQMEESGLEPDSAMMKTVVVVVVVVEVVVRVVVVVVVRELLHFLH